MLSSEIVSFLLMSQVDTLTVTVEPAAQWGLIFTQRMPGATKTT